MQPLIDYLKNLQAKGETHVSITDSARIILRGFYRNSREQHVPDKAPSATRMISPVARAVAPPNNFIHPEKEIPTGQATLEQLLTSLKLQHTHSEDLKTLGTLRSKIVFPATPKSAALMFIGEAPSFHDESKGYPFAGPAGKKLNAIMSAMGLSRETAHVTTILKFRPKMQRQTTNDRNATMEELHASKELLDAEIKAINPTVLITLGEGAAQFLTGKNAPLDSIREQNHTYLSKTLIPTYHPSFLLHKEETADKRRLWQDMLKGMSVARMPISPKQQNYFSK